MRFSWRPVATVAVSLLFAAGLTGCGGGSDSGAIATRTLSSNPVKRGDLILSVSSPRNEYKPGESVPVTITVQNTAGVDTTYSYIRRKADAALYDNSDNLIQYDAPVTADATIRSETIAAGEIRYYQATVYLGDGATGKPIATGEYRIFAWLAGDNLVSPPKPSSKITEPLAIQVIE